MLDIKRPRSRATQRRKDRQPAKLGFKRGQVAQLPPRPKVRPSRLSAIGLAYSLAILAAENLEQRIPKEQ